MLGTLEKLLHDNDITAYTIVEKATGKGKDGQVRETMFGETNMLILAVLSSDRVQTAVDALKTFVTARTKAAHGQSIPLKVFCSPCEELL